MNPPTSPPPKGGPPRAVLMGAGAAVLVGVAVTAFLVGRGTSSPPTTPPATVTPSGTAPPAVSAAGSSIVQSLPPASTDSPAMEIPSTAARPAFWLDVYAPGKVRDALVGNAWVKEQLDKPLGKGFVGGWAALLGSRGEELGGAFQGAVFDVLVGKVLTAPFRVVWFIGPQQTSTPAILVPDPGNAAMAAFDSLATAVRRNTMQAASCPEGAGEPPSGGFTLQRWLVAEQALWAARTEHRIVLGRHPAVVLQGLCEGHLELAPPEGVDVELGFAPKPLGREAQLLSHVVGIANGMRLQFAAEGNRLVGRGITGPVAEDPRLDSAPLSDALLKLVPEDTPVLLTLQLKLPEQLDAPTLRAYWSGKGFSGPVRTRQVALVWTPRGNDSISEVALLWGRPEDAAALDGLFSGHNVLSKSTQCGHYVMASTPGVLERLTRACSGKVPNLLNAAGPVVQGLRAKGSMAFGINTGRLLSRLLVDGYGPRNTQGAVKAPPPPPPEIEAARRDLETLPYLGLRGTVEGNRLVPGGFGS